MRPPAPPPCSCAVFASLVRHLPVSTGRRPREFLICQSRLRCSPSFRLFQKILPTVT